MGAFTKVDYIELTIPNGSFNSNGRIYFPSQSNLENKLVKKIVVCTRTQGTPYSPSGRALISDGNAETMWLTLQTTYDTLSGSNNQGANINNLQMSMLASIRGNYSTTGQSNFFTLAEQDVPEWSGVFVNWVKSSILINYTNDSIGTTPANKALVLAVYYDDMYTSNGIPVANNLAAIQEANMQMEQQIQYLKGFIPQTAQVSGNGYL